MTTFCDLAFAVTKNFFPEKSDDWCKGFSAELEKLIMSANVIRCAIVDEKLRIAEIIAHGNEIGDLQSAVNLALTSELSAADAIAIMAARDDAEPIRPN